MDLCQFVFYTIPCVKQYSSCGRIIAMCKNLLFAWYSLLCLVKAEWMPSVHVVEAGWAVVPRVELDSVSQIQHQDSSFQTVCMWWVVTTTHCTSTAHRTLLIVIMLSGCWQVQYSGLYSCESVFLKCGVLSCMSYLEVRAQWRRGASALPESWLHKVSSSQKVTLSSLPCV